MVGPQDILGQLPGGKPAMPGRGMPFAAQPPVPTNTIPRSDTVIKYSHPVPTDDTARLSVIAQRAQSTSAMEQFELDTLKKAHMAYIAQSGGDIKPLPVERDIRIGNTVIPKELVRRIGRWSMKIPPPAPEQLKRPDEVW